ncbi:alpha/beta hydrolase [Halomonas sp. SpR8]|uniref:alpha/beta hydrolase n=1 Tax=Halomonas sp. SpR8 TaxID=3050463 RepID=UPI0027E4011C|nr:alpha/beta hydrolase [Halomonas sp. SpR8]MDQ7730336.1 alpha/beta hydrolase [Halomonas sp. SpR8]
MSICALFIQGGGEGAHAEDEVLASSLKRALGPDYDVRYPRMPDESNPSVEVWGRKISSELSKISGEVILVAHSVGGSILLQYLSGEKFGNSIGGLFVLAAPTWDDNQWNFDDLKLPGEIADKLAQIPRIFFYHCRDDEIVPFAHLALHAAQIPKAITREISHGGHQFGNDLTRIAMDIRGDEAG